MNIFKPNKHRYIPNDKKLTFKLEDKEEILNNLDYYTKKDIFSILSNSVLVGNSELALDIINKIPDTDFSDFDFDFDSLFIHSNNIKFLNSLINDDRYDFTKFANDIFFETFKLNIHSFEILLKSKYKHFITEEMIENVFIKTCQTDYNLFSILILENLEFNPYIRNHYTFIYMCDNSRIDVIQSFINNNYYQFNFNYDSEEKLHFLREIYKHKPLKKHIINYLSRRYSENISNKFKTQMEKEELNKKINHF